jgi:hypothetical protein
VGLNLEGLEPTNFHKIMLMAGDCGATDDDTAEWLDADKGETGYQIMAEEEFAQDVSAAAYEEQDS